MTGVVRALILAALCGLILGSCKPNVGPRDEVAVLETNYGRIVFEFLPDDAPRHVANFKELTREGFYNGTRFHKIVKDRRNSPIAIQGGDPNTISGAPSTWGYGQPGQKTIPAEFSKTLRHSRGTVSAARRTSDPNSATSQFFICVTDDPEYDGQFSIFARVIDGMNIVESIAKAPTLTNSTVPLDPVVVQRIYLVRRSELDLASGN
ncbi:MAG TPA: peptidylprolyl isomerase [Blastocatellia bacterium]|nr:peptidylprolyl isomerase [Blastocatellia bacterium]